MPKRLLIQCITLCARCGGNHENLEFIEFSGNPISDSDGLWNFWSICPVTSDPILLRILDEYGESVDPITPGLQPLKGFVENIE
jgi:hypothetical protein